MAKRSLRPYREARMSPLMVTIMVIGIILMTIFCFVIMQVPSLA